MALNAYERTLLEDARERIAAMSEPSSGYICLALVDAMCDRSERDNGTGWSDARDRLSDYIDRRLKGRPTLGAWQESCGIFHNRTEQRADRIAWIDWMLGG